MNFTGAFLAIQKQVSVYCQAAANRRSNMAVRKRKAVRAPAHRGADGPEDGGGGFLCGCDALAVNLPPPKPPGSSRGWCRAAHAEFHALQAALLGLLNFAAKTAQNTVFYGFWALPSMNELAQLIPSTV